MSADHRKVRLASVRRPDMTLVIPAADGSETEYVVRGQLSINEVIEMYELQQAMSQLDGDNALPMLHAIRDAQGFLTRLVRERYPDAPAVDLSLEEMMVGFTAMLGGVTAAEEIAKTLVDGLDIDADEEVPAEMVGDPTVPLSAPSSPASLESASTTSGGQNGGETSVGQPSPSTSAVTTSN